jgi:hypothetical protein
MASKNAWHVGWWHLAQVSEQLVKTGKKKVFMKQA